MTCRKAVFRHNTPCSIRHKEVNTQNGRKMPFFKPGRIVLKRGTCFVAGRLKHEHTVAGQSASHLLHSEKAQNPGRNDKRQKKQKEWEET